MQNFKVVFVGDGAVGKTSSLLSFTTGSFPSEYCPTVFDNYSHNVIHEGTPISVGLWDTAGKEDYDRLRPLSYPQTDVFVIMYSCVSQASLENVQAKWWPELTHHCPEARLVLCCNKIDLREDYEVVEKLRTRNQRVLTAEDGMQVARNIRAEYCEQSALTQEGLAETFETVFRSCVGGPKTSGKECPPKPDAPDVRVDDTSIAYATQMRTGGSKDVRLELEGEDPIEVCWVSTPLLWQLSGKGECAIFKDGGPSLDAESVATVKCVPGLQRSHVFQIAQWVRGRRVTDTNISKLRNLCAACCDGTPLPFEDAQDDGPCVESLKWRWRLIRQDALKLQVQPDSPAYDPHPRRADCTVTLSTGTEFACHKAILDCRCPDLLRPEFRGDISDDAFVVLLQYVYTNTAEMDAAWAKEILPHCHMKGLQGLRQLCEKVLAASISDENVAELLALASQWDANQLRELALWHIAMDFVHFEEIGVVDALMPFEQQRVRNDRWPPADYMHKKACLVM